MMDMGGRRLRDIQVRKRSVTLLIQAGKESAGMFSSHPPHAWRVTVNVGPVKLKWEDVGSDNYNSMIVP